MTAPTWRLVLSGIAATASRTCGTERTSQRRSRSRQDATSGVKEAFARAIII
jgi:hypothetical protein